MLLAFLYGNSKLITANSHVRSAYPSLKIKISLNYNASFQPFFLVLRKMILLNMICLYIQYNDQHLTKLIPISSNQGRLICKRIHLHVNLISIWRDSYRVQGSFTYYQFSELVLQAFHQDYKHCFPIERQKKHDLQGSFSFLSTSKLMAVQRTFIPCRHQNATSFPGTTASMENLQRKQIRGHSFCWVC